MQGEEVEPSSLRAAFPVVDLGCFEQDELLQLAAYVSPSQVFDHFPPPRIDRTKSDKQFSPREMPVVEDVGHEVALAKKQMLTGGSGSASGSDGGGSGTNKPVEKVVVANGFPKGWTVVAGMVKRDGTCYMSFRDYTSPDGKVWPSFKEAAESLVAAFHEAGQAAAGKRQALERLLNAIQGEYPKHAEKQPSGRKRGRKAAEVESTPIKKPRTTEITTDADPKMTMDAEPEMTTEADSKMSDAGPEMTMDAEPEMTMDAEPEMTMDAEPEMTMDAESDSEPETEADPKTNAEPEMTTEAGPKTTTDAEPEMTTDADPKATTDAEPDPKMKMDATSEKLTGWCDQGCIKCKRKIIQATDCTICSWCESEYHNTCVASGSVLDSASASASASSLDNNLVCGACR